VEWLQWEARPWRVGDGSIGGLIFFTQVITARKEMELELVSRRAELERSNQDLEQFAYVASHDLQEPLRAVAGCGQILQRRYGHQLEPMAGELIQHMVEGAARMQALILDLLAFSRVGARGHELVPIDSAEALKRALKQLEGAMSESHAELEVASLPRVRGDVDQLTQLFQNLMGNAIKYRSDAPVKIAIDARSNGSSWQFSVRDNGIGIEPQYFEKIFVLFQRLHTREEYPGTGIGLAICKKIVERHGGRIWVESTLGQGTSFHFTLPRGDA
jgi:light-regulated signal transduction histidine kinase (bacteriophytochrome)